MRIVRRQVHRDALSGIGLSNRYVYSHYRIDVPVLEMRSVRRSFHSVSLGQRSSERQWRNVWSAAEVQEEICPTRTVCENVSGLLVENALPAHDDDPRVPVLLIATVVNDLVTPQVLRHAV